MQKKNAIKRIIFSSCFRYHRSVSFCTFKRDSVMDGRNEERRPLTWWSLLASPDTQTEVTRSLFRTKMIGSEIANVLISSSVSAAQTFFNLIHFLRSSTNYHKLRSQLWNFSSSDLLWTFFIRQFFVEIDGWTNAETGRSSNNLLALFSFAKFRLFKQQFGCLETQILWSNFHSLVRLIFASIMVLHEFLAAHPEFYVLCMHRAVDRTLLCGCS